MRLKESRMKTTAYKIDTFYQKIGQGPVIVLLHGWGQGWEGWNTLIPLLSKKNQLLIPDLPSFGKSQSPSNIQKWNSKEYVLWLEEFLKKTLGDKKIILVGHSIGGKIAALFAANHPKKVTKLFLIAPSGIPDKINFLKIKRRKVLSIIPKTFKQKVPHRLKNKLLKHVGASPDYLNATAAQRIILKNVIQEDITPFLSKILTPTFLFWCTSDRETPYENHKIFLNHIQGAKLIKFENAGHFPFLEKETQFKKEITKII